MRVEKQGYFECMLVTIAALGDVSLAEVRDAGCAKANVNYWSHLAEKEKAPVYWKTVRYLTRHYKASGVPTKPIRIDATPGNTKRIKLNGRGSILIRAPNKRESHIMPFEDGLIYNPSDPNNPFPLNDLEARFPRWTIRKITKSRNKNTH